MYEDGDQEELEADELATLLLPTAAAVEAARPAAAEKMQVSHSIFGDFRGHADGERRGLDRIGPVPMLPSDSIQPLGVRRRHAPKSCQK